MRKQFYFLSIFIMTGWLAVSTVSVSSEQDYIEGGLRNIDYNLRQLQIDDSHYRIAVTALVILEDGSYGSLKEVGEGAYVHVRQADGSGEITELKVITYR